MEYKYEEDRMWLITQFTNDLKRMAIQYNALMVERVYGFYREYTKLLDYPVVIDDELYNSILDEVFLIINEDRFAFLDLKKIVEHLLQDIEDLELYEFAPAVSYTIKLFDKIELNIYESYDF